MDDDQQGPFSTVEYKVLDGPYSQYVSFVTPLEGTLVLRKPLDYETLKNFTLTLRAQDQGNPPRFSDTTLDVVVLDADDQNPKFLQDSYTAELPISGRPGELRAHPEAITAVDQDEGIQSPIEYSITKSVDSKYFTINKKNGVVSITEPVGPNDFVHSITLVIKATQVDNHDRYALTTLAVGRRDVERNRDNENRFAFLQNRFQAKISEDIGIGSRLLALPTNRPGRQIQYHILDPLEAQFFRIGTLGEIILQKSLDYENATKHVFQVMGTDGITNATTEVIIEVLDVNDWEPRFRQQNYEFTIPKIKDLTEPIPLGKLEVADGDRDDKVNIHIRGPYSTYFQIDTNGMLWLKPNRPNITLMHLIATATDTGLPTRSSSVPVTILNDSIAMAQTNWAPGILGAFGAVLGLFILTIIAMCVYIYKQREPKGSRNRVHSHDHSATSAVNLVGSVDKTTSNSTSMSQHLQQVKNPNVRLSNPLSTLSTLNNNNHLAGSGSSISAGASTILAATLEREAQRDRDMENYTATVRSECPTLSCRNCPTKKIKNIQIYFTLFLFNIGIISRASAARGGLPLYDDDLEHDSISNSETNKHAWALPEDTRTMHMPKKLSWNNGGPNPIRKVTIEHEYFNNNYSKILY